MRLENNLSLIAGAWCGLASSHSNQFMALLWYEKSRLRVFPDSSGCGSNDQS